MNDLYEQSLQEAKRGAFVAFLPSLDECGPMVFRVFIDKHQIASSEFKAPDEDRTYIAMARMIRARREQKYPIPTNKDYARGRN